MRNIWIIVFMICFCSCKKNNEASELTKTYVQAGEIQLTNPRIKVDNVIIDTSSKITASLQLDKAAIYYTKDGSEPTQTSEKYTKAILVSEPGIYTFKAFHPDFRPSEIETVTFYKKGTNVYDISLVTPLNEKYPGQGKNTLINHKKGTSNFRDGQWIGITEPLIAIVDFKNTTFLESVDIGYLVNTSAWIFPIQSISISSSEDGINFIAIEIPQPIEQFNGDITNQGNIHIPISKELKKIKIEISNTTSIPQWHQGSGNAAWLFMDEWIFNTRNN